MKESQTKEIIKTAARNIFFKRGNIHATTSDIAIEAGVNRALIHYYFSSREHLLEIVLKEAFFNMSQRLQKAIAPGASFRDKIEKFLDIYIEESIEFPFIENFIISEINRSAENQYPGLSKEIASNFIGAFFQELVAEMEKGNISAMPPEQFLINMVSLCSYPLIARPLIQRTFNMDDESYLNFIRGRRQYIHKLIFRE